MQKGGVGMPRRDGLYLSSIGKGLLTRQCNECEIPSPPTKPPSLCWTEVALLARKSSSAVYLMRVLSSRSCHAWSSSGRGLPMNFLVFGSPVSHLLTYFTGAGAVSGVSSCERARFRMFWTYNMVSQPQALVVSSLAVTRCCRLRLRR